MPLLQLAGAMGNLVHLQVHLQVAPGPGEIGRLGKYGKNNQFDPFCKKRQGYVLHVSVCAVGLRGTNSHGHNKMDSRFL